MAAKSWRSVPLPKGWQAIRAAIIERDGGRCTWTDRGIRCTAPATDVDHETPAHKGGSDDATNLRSLCSTHHNRKSSAEANAVNPMAAPRRRTPEPHPGLVR